MTSHSDLSGPDLSDLGQCNILIVDDVPENLDVLIRILEDDDYQVKRSGDWILSRPRIRFLSPFPIQRPVLIKQ